VLAAALADPSRSRIVCVLMDGRAYTAKELAYQARISAQTASFHLQHLVAAGIIKRHAQGRHRYHQLANEQIAAAVEALAVAAPVEHLRRLKPGAAGPMRLARSCYNHVAGRLGVAIAGRLVAAEAVLASEDGLSLSNTGRRMLGEIGLASDSLASGKRVAARQCMDWTERRFHFAGTLGVGLMRYFIDANWLTRVGDSRVLAITAKGGVLFQDKLGLASADLTIAEVAA